MLFEVTASNHEIRHFSSWAQTVLQWISAHCGSLRGAGPKGGRARRYAHNVRPCIFYECCLDNTRIDHVAIRYYEVPCVYPSYMLEIHFRDLGFEGGSTLRHHIFVYALLIILAWPCGNTQRHFGNSGTGRRVSSARLNVTCLIFLNECIQLFVKLYVFVVLPFALCFTLLEESLLIWKVCTFHSIVWLHSLRQCKFDVAFVLLMSALSRMFSVLCDCLRLFAV